MPTNNITCQPRGPTTEMAVTSQVNAARPHEFCYFAIHAVIACSRENWCLLTKPCKC